MVKHSEILGINHLGLTVPDVDQATHFLKAAFGAKLAYASLTQQDSPRQGMEVERQLGLAPGSKIVRQQMVVIGKGPSLELFEIQTDQQQSSATLGDQGITHFSIFVNDLNTALDKAVAAGATALSEIHGNSKYEDTPGNGSVYVKAPWGTLIELQTIPNGYYYPSNSEAKLWLPTD
ncbi:VOC family protein [Liquorilactobacillus nagelii]|uniref:VOC family protein n=1 Tax=Liquorilactobacillus nagelii TaxID=82688 RepID=UPI001CCBDE84|nr:VOC family protein [Liquorilactobacillus nagelii]ULQ49199.1 VOC family protein [Liquorilactobacillus nagelii]